VVKFRAGDSPALKGAFSLVELIVVIAIVALLMALLLPALSRARRQANVVQCLANLHTIGHAALLHAHDHHNYLPSAGWEWDCENGLTNPAGMEDAAVQKYMYYSDNGVQRPLPVTAALAASLGVTVRTESREALAEDLGTERVRRLFRCPNQLVEISGLTQLGDDGGSWHAPEEVSGYAFNEAMLGRRPDPLTNGCPKGLLTRATNPSQTMFAMDGRTRDPASSPYFLVFNDGTDETLYDFDQITKTGRNGAELLDYWRHDRKVNIVFLDGHAETIAMEDEAFKQVWTSRGTVH
jgi:prepilin-type processing-associated H-X9-DG protein/prepilin-type N-terminal cleavage/methylation domain-containing protein